jgi:dienelactone hydrolase
LKFGLTAAVAAAVLIAVAPVAEAAYRLAPYKDDLFKYPGVLETTFGGDYVKVDYVESRDLYDRDIVPEKETKPQYLDMGVKASQRDMVAKSGRVSVQYIAVGAVDGGADAIVLYVHGRGGNRGQGANDGMFGGNFNRIKNLMARNGGVYLSGEFPNLNARGVAQAKVLLQKYIDNSPGAPVFVACGSLGGRICWGLAEDPEIAQHIDGYILMGSTNDQNFFRTDAFKRKVPVYIGHGTGDIVISWKQQEAFFKKFKQLDPNYPVKFALFNSGSHGTPIRMTDWRLILNWMLEVGGA